MMKFRPKMFIEAEKNHTSPKLLTQIFAFIAFFFISQLIVGLIASVFVLPSMMVEMAEANTADFDTSYQAAMKAMGEDPKITLISLYATVIGTIMSILYCRTIEHRSYGSMGVRKRRALPHYLTGLAVGLVLMGVITAISVLTGISEIRISDNINLSMITLFFFGFLLQGMSEEFIFRGYFMTTIGGRHSASAAIIISSVGFAAAHLANPGISVLAFINLTLFGIFAALYMICFDDIWGACAIHSIWNFTQGNVFGISVSGTGEIPSFFRTTALSSAEWLSGGTFGIEGSILTTIVLIIASSAVFMRIRKQAAASETTEEITE